MNSEQYLINAISDMHNKFNSLKIKFGFGPTKFHHIIDIYPRKEYISNRKFNILKDEIEKEFKRKYPNKELIFISEGSLFGIEHIIKEIGYETR